MTARIHSRSRIVTILTIVFLVTQLALTATAQTRRAPRPTTGVQRPRDFRSKNFLIHTDMAEDDAKELLSRLETMLSLISKYWQRPNPRLIECFVVEDLKNWPQGVLSAEGLASIQRKAGVTRGQVLSQGARFRSKATVYAVASRGTPLHEAVHAYCIHAFGRTGPVWYSEGMAEMGQYWRDGDSSVNCHGFVVDYLRKSEPKPLREIVKSAEITGDSWQNYAWRWALCHLLANNPNYSKRFRPLGLGLLTKQTTTTFKRIYGSQAEEISFEYLFFLQHLSVGYRVDLCAWDWKARFRRPRGSANTTATIQSARGWQPSLLTVQAGEEYELSTTGSWKVATDGPELSAAGTPNGAGTLVGAIFNDYMLGDEFPLGGQTSFRAESDGKLMLRCRDAWNELSDNSGKLTVKLRRTKLAKQ